MVALKQSATVLRSNLMHVQGSPDQHKKIDPSKLRCIQRRVQTSWKILTLIGLKGHGLVSMGAGPWHMPDIPGATTTWVKKLSGVT